MLADKVKQLEISHENMRQALCAIARIAAYHDPLPDVARKQIQHIAETAAGAVGKGN